MTLLEAAVTILSGILALLGGGAAVRWIDARRSITERALDMADHGREDTARHATGWTECERRCGRLEGENAKLRRRVDELEGENARLHGRVDELETEVGLMRAAINALLAGQSAPGSEQHANITPIGVRKG